MHVSETRVTKSFEILSLRSLGSVHDDILLLMVEGSSQWARDENIKAADAARGITSDEYDRMNTLAQARAATILDSNPGLDYQPILEAAFDDSQFGLQEDDSRKAAMFAKVAASLRTLILRSRPDLADAYGEAEYQYAIGVLKTDDVPEWIKAAATKTRDNYLGLELLQLEEKDREERVDARVNAVLERAERDGREFSNTIQFIFDDGQFVLGQDGQTRTQFVVQVISSLLEKVKEVSTKFRQEKFLSALHSYVLGHALSAGEKEPWKQAVCTEMITPIRDALEVARERPRE